MSRRNCSVCVFRFLFTFSSQPHILDWCSLAPRQNVTRPVKYRGGTNRGSLRSNERGGRGYEAFSPCPERLYERYNYTAAALPLPVGGGARGTTRTAQSHTSSADCPGGSTSHGVITSRGPVKATRLINFGNGYKLSIGASDTVDCPAEVPGPGPGEDRQGQGSRPSHGIPSPKFP